MPSVFRAFVNPRITAAVALLAVAAAAGAQKKKPEEITQTLELPKDPPAVASGETRKLVFHISPLSTKGLLSLQTKDAVKAILKLNGNARIVHIRAFVAGNGDVRRVPQIVSEALTEKKQMLPSISVVRTGGLSLDNSQVVLEAVSLAKKDVNPTGLDFAESGIVTAPDPSSSPKPLLEKALDQLTAKAPAAGTLQVTCFVSTMVDAAGMLSALSTRFPGAVTNVVMTQRSPFQAFAACQSIRRGTRVTSTKLAFTGTRVAFGQMEKDAVHAFDRLDKDLTEAGTSPSSVVFTNNYPLSGTMAELSRKLRQSASPVAVIPADGVAAVEAGFAVDAIAAVEK